MQLNLWALPRCQLEGAALEAGVPLDTLLPVDFYDRYNHPDCDHAAGAEHPALLSWFAVHPVYHHDQRTNVPLTHLRLGTMAAILTKLGFSVYESGGSPLPNGPHAQDTGGPEFAQESSASLQTNSSQDYRTDVADTEKKAYYARSSLSWGWFLIFWMVSNHESGGMITESGLQGGALIFKATEGWTYGLSVYFC